LTVHQNGWKGLLAAAFQQAFDCSAFRESQRLLRQVETLDDCALLLGPIDVGRKAHKLLVDLHTTNTGTAAHGGIEYLDGLHLKLLVTKMDG
jgi:hypothetical protein